MAMSSWLESVMMAFAPSLRTTWSAPSRAMAGALPEFASASANRNSPRPACFSAWLAVPTARRMESVQLGVAIDPVRSTTWPSTTVAVFGACWVHAEHAISAAAANRTERIGSLLFLGQRGSDDRSRRTVVAGHHQQGAGGYHHQD